MTLDLYLFRHGESAYNAKEGTSKAVIGGRSPEIGLSKNGKRQAISLADELKFRRVSFDYIYTSPTVRTEETARIVADVLDFPTDKILTSEDLYEISNGDWEGRLKSEIYTPDMVSRINQDNWHFSPPRGESQQQAGNRIYDFVYTHLLKPLNQHSEVSVGLFTHGTTMKAFRSLVQIREIMKIPEDSIRNAIRSCIENCAISHFKYVPIGQKFDGWHEISWNEHGHLYWPGFKQEGYYPGGKSIAGKTN